MCGSAMPVREQRREQRRRTPPAWMNSSVTRDRVEQVAALAADRLRESRRRAGRARPPAGAARAAPRRRAPSRPGAARSRARRSRARSRAVPAARGCPTTLTTAAPVRGCCRDVDVPGAQPLAERLGLRVEPGLARRRPAPRRPSITKLTRAQVRQLVPLDGQRRRPPAAGRLSSSTVRACASHAPLLVGAHPDAEVRVAALVAAARADDRAERPRRTAVRRPAAPASARLGRRPRARGRRWRARCRRACRRAAPRRAAPRRRARTPAVKTPYGVASPGRRGQRAARVGRQRQLDRGGENARPTAFGVGIADDAVQQRARRPPRCRRPGGRCGPATSPARPAARSATPRAAAAPARPWPRCRVR